MDTQPIELQPQISKTQVIDLFSVSTSNISADSHPGFCRGNNEDSYAYEVNKKDRNALLIVADGVGGNDGGEIASRFTAQTLIAEWRKISSQKLSPKLVSEFFRTNISMVNGEIYSLNRTAGRLDSPMGTTVVALCLLPNRIVWASVGDSRIYRIRQGRIEQLTEDHSVVQKLVRAGKLTDVQAKSSPYAHVIYKSIGADSFLEPDLCTAERLNGDKFILCSDGLTDDVPDDVILRRMQSSSCAKEAVQNLLAEALAKGGHDNITIVCYYQR